MNFPSRTHLFNIRPGIDLITFIRECGFEAGSKVITTTDRLMQLLVNLKQ